MTTAPKKMGKQTVILPSKPTICQTSSIVGKKEGEGNLKNFFDTILEDGHFGEKSWEKAESKMMKEAILKAVNKENISIKDVEYIFGGDLLNQCISTSFGIRDLEIPFFGLFGACSTMAEGLSLSAMIIDGGFANYAIATTSSHFCSAEKQFRYPLEYGGQRPPTSQWTVTGSGAALVCATGNGPFITHITTGKIQDLGIKDANNMGAAMAPAAADTIIAHFEDTGRGVDYYDLVVTGDLGYLGKAMLEEMLSNNNIILNEKLNDCGIMIFDKEAQDTHSGGSGCGCSASVFCGYIFDKLRKRELNKVLFVATGALMSPTSTQQGESIPSIAHAVAISNTLD